MKKKENEIPTFTILNPDFHGPENLISDSGALGGTSELPVNQSESYPV